MRVLARYLFVAFGGQCALSSRRYTSAVESNPVCPGSGDQTDFLGLQVLHKIFWALPAGGSRLLGRWDPLLDYPCPVSSGLSGRDLLVGFPLRRRILLCNRGTTGMGPLTW